jgi:hypothetical protein
LLGIGIIGVGFTGVGEPLFVGFEYGWKEAIRI